MCMVFAMMGEGKVDWPGAQRTFARFADRSGRLDAREFVKMCRLCDFIDDHSDHGLLDVA